MLTRLIIIVLILFINAFSVFNVNAKSVVVVGLKVENQCTTDQSYIDEFNAIFELIKEKHTLTKVSANKWKHYLRRYPDEIKKIKAENDFLLSSKIYLKNSKYFIEIQFEKLGTTPIKYELIIDSFPNINKSISESNATTSFKPELRWVTEEVEDIVYFLTNDSWRKKIYVLKFPNENLDAIYTIRLQQNICKVLYDHTKVHGQCRFIIYESTILDVNDSDKKFLSGTIEDKPSTDVIILEYDNGAISCKKLEFYVSNYKSLKVEDIEVKLAESWVEEALINENCDE